ncbi:glycosyltransferase [Thermococcus onnurineus NA1]|uniref:Glycosyltransferase n=1 Tax=Thermococcus onnurineus (strain NA1) TaxID=523850 RepID=B6YUV9_THEON|nr:glycosyltransferase family 4 protein [Thermococcus onnurineus]ACJ17187.1 glycosyltransferase [Thermococcus onnurineus NA1]
MKRVVMTLSNPFKPDPRVYKEASSLVKAGYDVTIIAWDREEKYPKMETMNGIKILRIHIKSCYGLPLCFTVGLFLFYLRSLFLLMKMDFDIIHTHDFDTAILGFILKKMKNKVWVYDVHDLYESMVKLVSGEKLARIVRYVDSYFQKNADLVFTASQKVKQVVQRNNKNVFVILNTVNPDYLKNLPKYPTFTIFYGGVLSGNRFLLEMLKIAERLGVTYRVAGKGWVDVEEILKKQLGKNFLGFIPHEQIFVELERAHLTFAIYDPRFENIRLSLPNKVFEAASVKTPILVSRGTALAELVESMKIGWAVEYEVRDVENMVFFLLANPKHLKKAGHIGHKIYLKKYTWNFVEQILFGVYPWGG